MEFYSTTFKGYKITVIFNGPNYFFYSAFYGLVAVAERSHEINDGKHFVIDYGNDHLIGGSLSGSAVVPYVKKFISKCEQKYIQCSTTYTVNAWSDLSQKHLKISAI